MVPSRTEKIYNEYSSSATLLTDYQLCKSFLRDGSISLSGVAERILLEKFNQPWQADIVSKAVRMTMGQRDPMVEISRFNYSERISGILRKYVKKNFVRMIGEVGENALYPYSFRRIVEKHR